MAYTSVSRSGRWPALLAGPFLCVALAACGGGSGEADGTGGTGGTGGPMGCLVQNFTNQPDVLFGPEIELRVSAPGSTVEFSLRVDGDTRLVKATLMDAWRLRQPAQGQSETAIMNTLGNEEMEFAIPIQTTGRYYVDLELCGSSCDSLRVVYTLNRANAGEESDAINDPYERIVYEGDEETGSTLVRVPFSEGCNHPDSIAIQ